MLSIYAYFSPETLLPATSIIATALGFIMLVGRAGCRLAIRGWCLAANRSNRIAETSTPHYPQAAEHHHNDAYTYAASTQTEWSVGSRSAAQPSSDAS